MLTNFDLQKKIKEKEIIFNGKVRKDALLLSLGRKIQTFSKDNSIIDSINPISVKSIYGKTYTNWNKFILYPNQIILISANEFLKLSNTTYAFLSTLSHVSRLGLTSHTASFYIDRGFSGYITFEVVNYSPHPIILHQGMPFAKAIVFQSHATESQESESQRALASFYGSEALLTSKYIQEFTNLPKGV